MELFFGEYRHARQECGVHLRLARDGPAPRSAPPPRMGSYGVSIRVQGIDGHPYIVLNNAERCPAGRRPSEQAPGSPGSVPAPDEPREEELQFPENPYADPSPSGPPREPHALEGRTGALGTERKDATAKPSHVPHCQLPPEAPQPPGPEKPGPQPPASTWPRAPPGEGRQAPKDAPRGAVVAEAPEAPEAPGCGPASPDVLPLRRQDPGPAPEPRPAWAGPTPPGPSPPAARAPQRLLLGEPDRVNRHENRRYIPFLPGTGRDVDTGSLGGVEQLIELFEPRAGPRRGRSGKRPRLAPEDRRRARSVDSAFPFGLRGSAEYLSEFTRHLGKSSEHLLRPSQVCPPRPQVPEYRTRPRAPTTRPQGPRAAAPDPAADSKEEDVKTATATLLLQNRGLATAADSGAKKISLKSFSTASNVQVTPDLLKGQQELTQQSNEETAKQILYNYLREGSSDNDDATKRKVNLIFEKIQTLKSRASEKTQGNHQASNSSSEVKDLLELKNKLTTEVSDLQRQLQLEFKNQQNLKEERERMRVNLEELQTKHASKVEENSALQRRLEASEGELRKNLEELFQVKMEREQHQTEIRDLQDQLSEMHDELDSAKQSEDREKGALIEELLDAKRTLQDLLVTREELEELLRRRERELTALKGALKAEVSSHDQEMDRLKEQYDAELQALRESVDEATKNVEVLASRSSAAEQSQAGAEQCVRLQEENERLRADTDALQSRVDQLRAQVHDAEGREAESQEALGKREAEVRQLEEALTRSRKEEAEARSACRALESELEEAQRELSRTMQEQKQMAETLRAETEQKEQLRRLKNDLESKRWHLDRTIEKLQKEVANTDEASRASTLVLRNQLDEHKEKSRKELAEVQGQLTEKALEAEKARLAACRAQDEVRLMGEELRDAQRARDEALTKQQLLEQTLKDLEYELEAKSHLKDDRSRLIKQMEDKVSQLELELEEERSNADALSERIARSRDQMEQVRSELLQERAVRQDLECDKISLERQNKDLKSRIIHLEGSYRSSKEGLVVQLEARIAELEDRLESEERERASLQLSNRRLERKVKELVMQVDDEHLSLTDQKDQLSLRLRAMKRQVEEAEEEIDRLESSKKKLQRELEEQLDVNEQLQGQLSALKKDLRLKKLPSKVLEDSDDDDDLSTDGGSVFEAPLGYGLPRDSVASQL
ncbi:cingulin-like protein 1 [Sorex fumeus]|uniref:cingulin-like protein 1 n=1 Tax=Sorex fumeus TaxID=62283 RepID=UPI0024AE8537|nr:cingulin-like protein 1 [Sorex fumeus]